VIWGSNRAEFGQPEVKYQDKSLVSVAGRIKKYRGVAEVVASEPAQIKARQSGEK
jgi:hypothetical protein